MNRLRNIQYRQLTDKNGKTTGYSSLTEPIKQRALENLSYLNRVSFDTKNMPLYYAYVPLNTPNTTAPNPNCQGDCQNGWGRWSYGNGAYEGYWQNGQKSGFGFYFWNNKDVYIRRMEE